VGRIFLYGEGVDGSIFFEVFFFEVCTDPFAGVRACGGEEVGFFELAGASGQNLLYLFKVVGVVGGYFYPACGL